jgi:hypothetical protein
MRPAVVCRSGVGGESGVDPVVDWASAVTPVA